MYPTPSPSILAEIAHMGRREIHGAVLLCCPAYYRSLGPYFSRRKCPLSHLPIPSQLKNRATGKYHEGVLRPSHLSLQVSSAMLTTHHIADGARSIQRSSFHARRVQSRGVGMNLGT